MTPLHLPSDDSSEGVGEPSEQVRRADQIRSPASNKKGGRECRQQKRRDERVEIAGVTSATTLFRHPGVPWAPFTNCQKKEGSHPLSVRRIAPSPKKHPKDYARFTYWSSPLRPNDYWGQQPKKKQRSHPLPVFDAFIPLRMTLFYVRSVTNQTAIRRTAH